MRKEPTLRSLIGAKQEDIAMLLNITRSHWSLYESGKRKLPLNAQQQLAEMLVYVQSPEAKQLKEAHKYDQSNKVKQQLERLLLDNRYKQAQIARKVEFMQRKYTENVGLLQLVNHLATKSELKATFNTNVLQILANTANAVIAKNSPAVSVVYEVKLETLRYEETLLVRMRNE